MLPQIPMLKAGKGEERFIDRIDFLIRTVLANQRHHPVRHIRIERVIGRQCNETCRVFKVTYFEPRRAHRNAECLGFWRTRHGASVIIR